MCHRALQGPKNQWSYKNRFTFINELCKLQRASGPSEKHSCDKNWLSLPCGISSLDVDSLTSPLVSKVSHPEHIQNWAQYFPTKQQLFLSAVKVRNTSIRCDFFLLPNCSFQTIYQVLNFSQDDLLFIYLQNSMSNLAHHRLLPKLL